ncbi:MAG: 50S ribosomal protein L21e [Candidatus Pacearchaeota archaeon]
MAKIKKATRESGKIKTSKILYNYKEGDKVVIKIDISHPINFPKRFNGKSGKIIGKKGKIYIVEIKDFNRIKKLLINPIHLKY